MNTATKLTWQGVKSALKKAGCAEAESRYSGSSKYNGFEVRELGKGMPERWHSVEVSYRGKWVHHWHAWTEEENAAWLDEHNAALLRYATVLADAGYAVKVAQQSWRQSEGAETTPYAVTVTLS